MAGNSQLQLVSCASQRTCVLSCAMQCLAVPTSTCVYVCVYVYGSLLALHLLC
jgi:hypothetical protein